MKEIARRDFLKLGAVGLAVASLGSSVTLGPLARKAGAVVVGATYFDAENQIMHGAYSNGRGGNANAQWDTAYNMDRYAALVGKSPLMVLAFQSLNVTPPPQGIIGVLNKYPHFCLTCCPEVTLDGIINGSQDARIDAWANACRNVGRVFYIRLMHEMNGDWYIYSYSKVSDGVNKYKQAFRRVVDRFRAAGATNVKWVFCPNTRSGSGAWSDPTPFANLYPGDSYVDVLGWDGYVNGGSHVDFSRVQGPAAQEMTALNPNKPQWLAEWGYDGLAGQKELYFQQAKAALQSADYSRVKCSNYFDSNQEGRNWAVNSPLAALDDYRALINDPVYQGTSLL